MLELGGNVVRIHRIRQLELPVEMEQFVFPRDRDLGREVSRVALQRQHAVGHPDIEGRLLHPGQVRNHGQATLAPLTSTASGAVCVVFGVEPPSPARSGGACRV